MFGLGSLISRLLWGRSLASVLNETKIVKVHGIRFTIKKVDPLTFLDGSKVMLQEFDTYQAGKGDVSSVTENALKKVKQHYTDVFCACVTSPQLVRKKEDATGDAIFVEYLFTEWELAHELYTKIVEFTYGKKKFKLSS